MSKPKHRKRTGKGLNISPELYARLLDYKAKTYVPIIRFVEQAIEDALAKSK